MSKEKSILISPSLLSADFTNLEKEVIECERAGADLLHIDVMDGHYVPNITIGLPVVKALKSKAKIPLDVHLMISNPDKYAEEFVKRGADFVSFHVETSHDVVGTLKKIQALGAKAGLVVNADVSEEKVLPYLEYVDFILVMSVQAGFGGQSFQVEALEKIKKIKAEIKLRKLEIDIEIDGGINEQTAVLAREAGANILVSGSTIFKESNRKKIISILRG